MNGSSGNDSNDGYSWDTAKLTIQNATGSVSSNGLVTIADGVYSGTGNTNITINQNMTIQGISQNGTIINGTDTNWIFTITTGVNVTICNLTFTNGNAYEGGAILNNGILSISNCTFTENTATHWGGAIFSYKAGHNVMSLTDCTFTKNTVFHGGGAIAYTSFCNVTNCTFMYNSVIGSDSWCGGAIGAYSGSNSIVTECTFVGNSVDPVSTSLGGGAIYVYDAALTANFNRFYNNSARLGDALFYNTNKGTMNAENNWWGSNVDPTTVDNLIYVSDSRFGFVDADPWIFLTVNATPNTINNTQTSLITASFNNHSSDGITYTTLDPNQGHIPDGTPVNFSLTNGPFGSLLPLTVYTSNGTASTLFTASSVGVQTVNATTDNQNVTASITINPSAHIQLDTFYADYNEFVNHNNIVKITDPVNYLDKVIVVITATNMGPDTITFLQLRDDWPDELVGTNQAWWRLDGTNWISEAWSPPGGSFSLWPTNLGDINPDDTFWCVIGTTVNKSNKIITNNITTINQIPVDTQGFDTKSANLQVNPAANLTVTKTGPTEAIAGTTITYTITVTNNGPDPAENVQIIDNIPAILQGVTHDSFNLGTIPSGQSRTITINGTIPSSTTKGTIIQNIATVTTSTPGTITPSLMVITTVDTQADVNLTQTVDNNRPEVGDTITYTVTIHNNGPSDATNIQIQDIMPSDFADVNIIPSKGTYDPGTRIWTLNLTSGETATLNLTGKVTAIMAGKNTTNTATLLGTTNQTNATIYVLKADLYVQITSDKTNPTVGETFTLTYKLGNNGPDTANNVTITIPLPEGFIISKIEGDGNWTVTGNTITWTMNNVTVGDPNLYITGWTTGIGNHLFTASITSDTFSTNSRGVSPLTLNTQPTVNAATTTDSKTVGMQNTGMPLAGIVLAIIMVFGGLISTRKKQ